MRYLLLLVLLMGCEGEGTDRGVSCESAYSGIETCEDPEDGDAYEWRTIGCERTREAADFGGCSEEMDALTRCLADSEAACL